VVGCERDADGHVLVFVNAGVSIGWDEGSRRGAGQQPATTLTFSSDGITFGRVKRGGRDGAARLP